MRVLRDSWHRILSPSFNGFDRRLCWVINQVHSQSSGQLSQGMHRLVRISHLMWEKTSAYSSIGLVAQLYLTLLLALENELFALRQELVTEVNQLNEWLFPIDRVEYTMHKDLQPLNKAPCLLLAYILGILKHRSHLNLFRVLDLFSAGKRLLFLAMQLNLLGRHCNVHH